MNTTLKDLAEFNYDDDFYPEINLLITIKSFNLKEIRERYLKNKNMMFASQTAYFYLMYEKR